MIHGLVMASLLYGPHTPAAERIQKLSELFEPRPGKLLPLDRISALENTKNPELIKGEIWIRPPKGQCLILRGDEKRRDRNICKPTPFKWTVDDLDTMGRFNLQVLLMEEWDDGVFLTWQTPYRIGNFVAAGDRESGAYEDVLIKTCKAWTMDGDRFAALEAFDGRRWKISLPEFDTPVNAVETEIPNLMVNIDTAKKKEAEAAKEQAEKKDEHGEKKDEHGAKPEDKKDAKPGRSVLGSLLSGEYKEQLKPKPKFHLPSRGAYRMESGRFTETGSPQGMTGECRYIFKNAPGDKSSGAIECHDTDTMDELYVHVPCFSELTVREKPKKTGKKEESKK